MRIINIIAQQQGAGAASLTPTPVGVVADHEDFSSLSGIDNNGAFTVTGSAVNIPVDSTRQKYFAIDFNHAWDAWKVESRQQIVSVDNSDFGASVGNHSSNVTGTASLCAVFVDNGSNAGKVAICEIGAATSTLYFSAYSSAAIAFSVGDTVALTLEATSDGFTATATINGNSISITCTVPFAGPGFAPLTNTGKPAVFTCAGSYRLLSLKFSSTLLKNTHRLLEGDSITKGFFAGLPVTQKRYGNIAGMDVVNGGPSDSVPELLLRRQAIVLLNPQKLFVMIGTNPDANYASHVQQFDSQMTAAGYPPIWIAPPANGNQDMSVFLSQLNTAFPGRVIDGFTPTVQQGTSHSVNPSYVTSYDSVHLNTPGHAALGNTISSSSLY